MPTLTTGPASTVIGTLIPSVTPTTVAVTVLVPDASRTERSGHHPRCAGRTGRRTITLPPPEPEITTGASVHGIARLIDCGNRDRRMLEPVLAPTTLRDTVSIERRGKSGVASV